MSENNLIWSNDFEGVSNKTTHVLYHEYENNLVVKTPACFCPSEDISKIIYLKNKDIKGIGNAKLIRCYVRICDKVLIDGDENNFEMVEGDIIVFYKKH